jgi:hypothetical protein
VDASDVAKSVTLNSTAPIAVSNVKGEFVAGGIHEKSSEWAELPLSEFAKNTIEHGYVIPFELLPVRPAGSGNRGTALANAEFVTEEISKLLASGAVERCVVKAVDDLASGGVEPWINPLSVATNASGKRRLVLDLSHLNKFVLKQGVKFDDLSIVKEFLPRSGFMCTFDLRSGYHHVLVQEAQRKFLCFEWNRSVYRFRVLPFGLTSAPWAFTKMLMPWVRKWRMEGIQVAVYIDDGLVWANDYESCFRAAEVVRRDLVRAGWVVAEDKSSWVPSQVSEWLGFKIDLAGFHVKLVQKRVDKAVGLIDRLLSEKAPSLYDRSKWTGTLASMSLVLPSDIKRWAKEVVTAVSEGGANGDSWSKKSILSKGEVEELITLREVVYQNEGKSLDISESLSIPGIMNTVGKHLTPLSELYSVHAQVEELKCSSFQVEKLLLVVQLPKTLRVLRQGSTQREDQKVAKAIWRGISSCSAEVSYDCCLTNMGLFYEAPTQLFASDEWCISRKVFEFLQSKWGKMGMDAFASSSNTKCEAYYSRAGDAGNAGVDVSLAGGEIWKRRDLWLVPPVSLLGVTINRLKHFKGAGILGFPRWDGQLFMTQLRKRDWIPEVIDGIQYPTGAKLFENRDCGPKFRGEFAAFPFVFLFVDFSGSLSRQKMLSF